MSQPNLVATTTLSLNGASAFTDELFVRERAIGLGGIEKADAPLDRDPHERNSMLLIHWRAVADAQTHASVPNSGDFKKLSEFAFLHCFLLD